MSSLSILQTSINYSAFIKSRFTYAAHFHHSFIILTSLTLADRAPAIVLYELYGDKAEDQTMKLTVGS